MKKTIITIAASLILMPTLALAGGKHHDESNLNYNGPVDLSSVTTLLSEASMFTEKDVIVEGYFLRQIKKDTYLFSDGEGEVQVELDDDINLTTPINAETKIRIYGEFEGGKTPEIEAERIQLL